MTIATIIALAAVAILVVAPSRLLLVFGKPLFGAAFSTLTPLVGATTALLGTVAHMGVGLSGGIAIAVLLLLLPFMMGTALTTARQTPLQGKYRIKTYPMKAGAKVFAGGFAAVDATGFLVDAADTAGLLSVGLVLGEGGPSSPTAGAYDNTSGSNGSILVPIACDCIAHVSASSLTQAKVGTVVMIADDQTVAPTSTNSVKAGVLVEFVSATEGLIYIPAAPAVI